MHRRTGLAALALVAVTMLSGCAASQSPVIEGSAVAIGVDVPYTGSSPASPSATSADLAVAAATLAGFSWADAEGERVDDPGFGTIERLAESPLEVRYTVADGIAWSDGVGIDGVDLLLDWVARAHPIPGPRFGSLPDPALAGAREARVSEDRKSLTIIFGRDDVDWENAFRAPLPAHAVAARAFGSPTPEAAKDDVLAAVGAALDGRKDRLVELAAAWSGTFAIDAPPPPASGPYRLVEATADSVELEVNPGYDGVRVPTFSSISIRTVADGASLVQGLSIGELDIVQFAWDEPLRAVFPQIGADRAELPNGTAPKTLVGWYHRRIDHVEPAPNDLGALWNPWQWAPYVLISD